MKHILFMTFSILSLTIASAEEEVVTTTPNDNQTPAITTQSPLRQSIYKEVAVQRPQHDDYGSESNPTKIIVSGETQNYTWQSELTLTYQGTEGQRQQTPNTITFGDVQCTRKTPRTENQDTESKKQSSPSPQQAQKARLDICTLYGYKIQHTNDEDIDLITLQLTVHKPDQGLCGQKAEYFKSAKINCANK